MEIKKVSYERKAYIYGIIMALGGLIFGFCIGLFNNFFVYFMKGKFNNKYSSSDYDNIKSLFNTTFNVGGFVCTLTATILLKNFGRKSLFYVCSLLISILCILQIWSPLWGMYIIRFCLGYIACFYTMLCPIMISETLPKIYVGTIGSYFYFMIAFGIQLAFFLKFDWVQKYYYLVICFPVVIEVFRVVLFYFVFNIETPRFIFLSNKKKLIQLKKKNSNNEPLLSSIENKSLTSETLGNLSITTMDLEQVYGQDERLKKFTQVFYQEKMSKRVIKNLYIEYCKTNKNQNKVQNPYKKMFSKEYRKQFFIVFLINLLNQLCGVNIIIFYSNDIFKTLNVGNPEVLTIIVGNYFYFIN